MGRYRIGRFSRSLGLTVAAVCGLGVGAVASVALAAPSFDPPGANGTVKIDGEEFDGRVDNEPHVTCDFTVNFFNFDEDERANIVLRVQSPTGSETVLLRLDDVLVSDDSADGAAPDPDEVFPFSTSQLGLDAFTAHPQQGYHIKLTVERIGAPGAGKHKVFWVQQCAAPTTSAPSPPPGNGTPTPSETTSPPGNGGNGLPITGAGLGGIVATGLGMIAAGSAAVVVARRRRTITESTES